MRIIRPDGREASWNIAPHQVLRDDDRPRSSLHLAARDLLREVFPFDRIYEEVPMPGTRLRCDFLVPARALMVEVQGRQHYKYSRHLHGSPEGFRTARSNDRKKLEFCELNEIRLVCLRFDDVGNWRGLLEGR